VWRITDFRHKSTIRHTQAQAQELAYYFMAKEAVQALVDLGVPREQIPVATEVDAFEAKMCQLAVETPRRQPSPSSRKNPRWRRTRVPIPSRPTRRPSLSPGDRGECDFANTQNARLLTFSRTSSPTGLSDIHVRGDNRPRPAGRRVAPAYRREAQRIRAHRHPPRGPSPDHHAEPFAGAGARRQATAGRSR
jgi:hypothetical protein